MKPKLILVLILLFGFVLRFFRLESVPPGLSNDEISIAYDSYSIITTGKDSSGVFLPLSFKSNSTYKAPLYVYVAGPFIKILGNNELAVRLPSVIFGTLTILFLYLLIKKVTGKQNFALISSFLLAITPWHVYTSRIALESNLALFFVVIGVYLFFEGFKNRKMLFLSSVSLAFSVYAYHTEWVFVPLIMIFLARSCRKMFKDRKDLIYWFLLFFLLVVPLGINWLPIRNETNRASTEFILNDLFLRNRLYGVANPISAAFIFVSFWIGKYLKYIDPGFIFVSGLPVAPFYSSPEFGLMNLVSFPVFVLGILELTKASNKGKGNLWFWWLGIGALVPSLTLGETNYVRYLVSVIPLVVVVAYGFIWIKSKVKYIFYVASLVLVTINFVFFYKYYIKLFPFNFSENWQYGYKQIAGYIKENGDKYGKIIIDPRFGVANNKYIGVPSLYLLYFNKLGRQEFMDKYQVREVDWAKEDIEKDTLYVVSIHSVPLKTQGDRVREVYSVNILDGTEAFRVYETH